MAKKEVDREALEKAPRAADNSSEAAEIAYMEEEPDYEPSNKTVNPKVAKRWATPYDGQKAVEKTNPNIEVTTIETMVAPGQIETRNVSRVKKDKG